MLESPLIQEIVAKTSTQRMHKDILSVLKGRFGPVPPDLVAAIQAIGAEAKLEKLVAFTGLCPDLEAFRARVQSVAGRRGRAKR